MSFWLPSQAHFAHPFKLSLRPFPSQTSMCLLRYVEASTYSYARSTRMMQCLLGCPELPSIIPTFITHTLFSYPICLTLPLPPLPCSHRQTRFAHQFKLARLSLFLSRTEDPFGCQVKPTPLNLLKLSLPPSLSLTSSSSSSQLLLSLPTIDLNISQIGPHTTEKQPFYSPGEPLLADLGTTLRQGSYDPTRPPTQVSTKSAHKQL